MFKKLKLVGFLGVLLFSGCSMELGKLGYVSLDNKNTQTTSQVAIGKACYYNDNFVPFAHREVALSGNNDALDRAVADALKNAGGGKALVNVEVSKTWAWMFLVIRHCIIVKGNIIR
ncbi:hypothetical protein [Helicobacter cetorum]|uniref:hypothetical protein n=1 Tax=Helicobacter cetorum TaxID=138563 RepID=UPI000CF02978|nr:hypothetical protein [Helicobacter cetorum]